MLDSYPNLLKPREVAEILRVSYQQIILMAHDGRLRHIRVGTRIIFRKADIEKFITDQLKAEDKEPELATK